jgi:hypothetical protein
MIESIYADEADKLHSEQKYLFASFKCFLKGKTNLLSVR